MKLLPFSELGKGKFGTVFLVEEVSSFNKYAAKFIKTRRRTYKEKALEEIEILKIVNHENIIKYVDSFIDNSFVVILMEYIDGGELFVKIADEDYSLTESDCVKFVKQICLGAEYLHSLNIVHLDLKVCEYQMSNIIKLNDSF